MRANVSSNDFLMAVLSVRFRDRPLYGSTLCTRSARSGVSRSLSGDSRRTAYKHRLTDRDDAPDLRYAARSLARMRGVAIVAILTLALGIGATTTMFSVVYAALLRPPPFSDPDRLVILFNTMVTPRDGLARLRWSRPHIVELQASATSFESVGSFTSSLLSASGQGDPEHIEGEVASPGYFQALRAKPVAGRTFHPEEDTVSGAQPVTIISARLWRRRFAADPSIVGATVRVKIKSVSDVAHAGSISLHRWAADWRSVVHVWSWTLTSPAVARRVLAGYSAPQGSGNALPACRSDRQRSAWMSMSPLRPFAAC